ncbi:peptidylprolyl isomerase [Candidatus Ruminimicrobiellum ovillum]|uniref:peptidylprolyl isomerase n=1 Tax=Candidatus Ruminimicrobiellum ovillum TaxID=1947927 RepID=UPI00355AB835
MKKLFVVMSLFVFLTTFVNAEEKSDVIATVNGKNITKTFVNKILQQDFASLPEEQKTEENVKALANKIVNQKIEEILLIDAAKKADVEVSKDEIQTAMNNIKSNFRTEKDFENDIKMQGLTKKEFESEVKESLMKIKYVSAEIKNRTQNPNEKEVKTFYNNIMSKIKGLDLELSIQEDKLVSSVANNLKRTYGEQVKIRQIFIKYSDSFTKEQKKEVNEKIKELKKELSLQDMNFARLSEKYSDDQVLRQKKGDLGFVLREDVTPEVAKVVFALPVGDYNKKPIQTTNGYHFFRVEEKKAKMPIEFDDVKDSLSDLLYKQNIQIEYDKLIAELKAGSDITIY